MSKTISQLTLSDFPNVYTINNHIRLVTNIPNLNPSLLGSRNRGYFIRVFNSSDAIPKIKKIYLAPQFDFYASDNTSSLTIPNSSQFKEVSNLDTNYYITTDMLGVAMKWFNGAMQDIVWAYFVTDETPHFTGKILNELNSSVTYSKDSNDTITITAKDGYKIKDATLEYQPYPGAGNETLGNFTISDNKLTATINIPDNVKNDSTINLVISGDTITDLEHINHSLKANNVSIKITGNTITLTAKQDVTINSLRAVADLSWAGDTYQLDSSAIKIADNKKSATITVPNDYNTKLGYTIVISGDFTKNTPIPTSPKATGTLHVYQLDDKALEDFSTKAVETFNSGHNEVYDFQKFITQLYKLPFFIPENESTGTTNILTGWYTINEPARLLNKNHYIKDLGNIKVLPVNNNGYDHNVTNCTLYLPFVSPISVSYETVLNHTVNIKYDTDLAGAKTTVNIFVDNELYKTIQVSIIENLDLYNIYNDSINGTLSSILNNTLDHCYIKVEYNKPIKNLISYETLEHNTLSNYTNFVKTKNANVSCGTQQEQIEIEKLLNAGVYIK